MAKPDGRRRRARTGTGLVRRYSRSDREAVREICRRTAFGNRGHAALFEDGEVHADYWSSYYTDYRPEETWVIEEDGKVIGYLFGCSDTRHYLRTMATRIVPKVMVKILWRLITGRYRKPETRRYIWHGLRRGAAESPTIDTKRYPAHFHINMLRQGYGKGYFSEATFAFLDHLDRIGVDRIHANVTEPAGPSRWGGSSERFGGNWAETTHSVPTRVFEVVTGDTRPVENRVFAARTAVFREWLEKVRKTHGM